MVNVLARVLISADLRRMSQAVGSTTTTMMMMMMVMMMMVIKIKYLYLYLFLCLYLYLYLSPPRETFYTNQQK